MHGIESLGFLYLTSTFFCKTHMEGLTQALNYAYQNYMLGKVCLAKLFEKPSFKVYNC